MKTIQTTGWIMLLCGGLAFSSEGREARLAKNRAPAVKAANSAAAPPSATSANGPTVQADLDEEHHFQEVKAKAENDPEIRKLKARSDTALTEAEAHESSIAYSRALTRKIGQIDPGLKDRADLVENAILRMLGE